MKTDCQDCLSRNHDCGGHWRRVVVPRGQITRGKVSLDVYDGDHGMTSAYDRDGYDPDQ